MKNKIIVGIIVVAFLTGAMFYMLKSQSGAETVKIGVLTPLTGPVAEYGNNIKDGIELAMQEINKDAGINGKRIELYFEDSKCDPAQALSGFNKLTDIDGVQIVLGTVCSSETLAIAPTANDKKVIVISAAASSPDITNAGDYIFRVYPSDTYEAGIAVDTIIGKLQKNRVSILYLNNSYGTALRDAFRNKFSSVGGKILDEEGYSQDSKDFRAQLSKIKDQNPDVIYMISYPIDGGLAIKQAKEMGMNAIFLGTSGLKANDFIQNGGISTEGFILASPSESYSTRKNLFVNNYEKRFAKKPGLASDLAYDSLYIIKRAFIGAKNIEEVKNNLYKVKEFEGASGEIGFDLNGDATNIKYSLFTIKNGQFIPLK